MSTNRIGIDSAKAEKLAEELNSLLSTYQVHYQNLRGFHWNIKGNQFFELHLKFEELYNDAQVKIDEIAERILTLGHRPLHSFSAYLDASKVKPVMDLSDGQQTIETVLADLKVILQIERGMLELASEAEDEGTLTLVTDYITQQEKLIWMLSSYLG